MIRILLFSILLHCALFASEVPDFNHPSRTRGAVFLLTPMRSGTNVISGSLCAITRKPISVVAWKDSILDPACPYRKHLQYNRIGVPLVSDIPLLYRTHDDFDFLKQIDSQQNKLIAVIRNPKELIYREQLRKSGRGTEPNCQFINEFLDEYLKRLELFDSWSPENRMLVYYEDFINQGDEILMQLLQFMGEEPSFLGDYLKNKESYIATLLKSYAQQQGDIAGSSSREGGPKPIYYTKNASHTLLAYIDTYSQRIAPSLWEKYLQRFKTDQ